MKKPPITLLQQRDFGQKMNASFEFAIQNIGPLVKTLAVISGPSALLAGIAQGMLQSNMLSSLQVGNEYGRLAQYFSVEYLFVMIFSLITYFLAFASVSAFVVLYEENGSSENITPGIVWSRVMENSGGSIGGQVISLILILIGMVFLIIPGLYLATCLQLFMMAAIRENLSAKDSLLRSYELTKGKWWSTFGLIIIMSVVTSIIALVFQVPTFVTTIATALGLGNGLINAKPFMIIAGAISMVGTSIVQGLIWIAVAFQYYNLVERSEGSGLRTEIASLGNKDMERPNDEDRF